jgi:lysophospholipase L1-like esterase
VVETGVLEGEFTDGATVSEALAPMLETYCGRLGLAFLDAGALVAVSPVDGVHLEPDAHGVLGRAVAEAVRAL